MVWKVNFQSAAFKNISKGKNNAVASVDTHHFRHMGFLLADGAVNKDLAAGPKSGSSG